ncbi:Uncharacterised protein [Legionella pneumophila]|nr:hypothetical protein LPE509_00776 [Legionella pneumophila subsp. pneumophila LPE509]CZG45648.1 Uncharacterised protein [Legionella pneumophila]CZG51891.1 Uncharacterised protein [Legionella pneumophila]CZG69128.1 Uncharacterised protein [Legionella pneumophila]CZG71075.1 Uncharacterised protein [Legionella pneumophila]
MPYYLLTKIFDELFKFFRELSLREVIASFLYHFTKSFGFTQIKNYPGPFSILKRPGSYDR